MSKTLELLKAAKAALDSFPRERIPHDTYGDSYEVAAALRNHITELEKTGNRIEVDTPFGNLFAEVGGHPEYPEIFMSINREDDYGVYERPLVLVGCKNPISEYNDGEANTFRLIVWNDDENDGDTTERIFYASP